MVKTRRKEMTDRLTTDMVLQPEVRLLVKLASIAIHAEEMMSASGHHFDAVVLKQLLADREVTDWLKEMDKLALIPKKR